MQVQWGARYSGLTNQGYRWFTSVLVHTSGPHILANTLVFLALAASVERKLGSLRMAGAHASHSSFSFASMPHRL